MTKNVFIIESVENITAAINHRKNDIVDDERNIAALSERIKHNQIIIQEMEEAIRRLTAKPDEALPRQVQQ